jgi:hypothetical protein
MDKFLSILLKIIEWANSNSGFLSILLLIITILFGFITPKYFEKKSKKGFRKDLKELLILELLANIDFVAQVDSSHNKNLKSNSNLYVPAKSPRIAVIEKFIQYDVIFSLTKSEREKILNVYAQLKSFSKEFFIWRESTAKIPLIVSEKLVYEQLSLSMSNHITILMENMIDLWVIIINENGTNSSLDLVKDLNNVIKDKIKEGKWIRASYKSSYFDNIDWKNTDKFDVIICWINDGSKTNKEIIEIKSFISVGGI